MSNHEEAKVPVEHIALKALAGLERGINRVANALEPKTVCDTADAAPNYLGAGSGVIGRYSNRGTMLSRRKGPHREIKTSSPNFSEAGQVEHDTFTNRDGSILYAHLMFNEDQLGAFQLNVDSALNSPMGLRELACELAMLADHLDGCNTQLTLTPPDAQLAEPALTKRQIAARKGAMTKRKAGLWSKKPAPLPPMKTATYSAKLPKVKSRSLNKPKGK